jgi:hypothetical protein
MKKTLALVTLLAGAASVYSQGQLNFSDYGVPGNAFAISIWSPVAGAPAGGGEVQGNTPVSATSSFSNTPDVPAGTTTYTGSTALGGSATGSTAANNYANGNLWSVELYAASGSGIAVSALAPVSGSISTFFNDSAVQGNAGEWNAASAASGSAIITFGGASGTAGAPTVAGGAPVTVAIAAWYNGGGAYTSYAAAQAALVPFGMSTAGSVNVTSAPNPPAVLPALGGSATLSGGITSFSLNAGGVVPEPSTIALGVMGASAFLMRLRRK